MLSKFLKTSASYHTYYMALGEFLKFGWHLLTTIMPSFKSRNSQKQTHISTCNRLHVPVYCAVFVVDFLENTVANVGFGHFLHVLQNAQVTGPLMSYSVPCRVWVSILYTCIYSNIVYIHIYISDTKECTGDWAIDVVLCSLPGLSY